MSPTFGIFWIIVLFANFTEAIAGFGSTLLALTLGAEFYPVEGLVPLLVPLNLVLSAVLVFKHHRDVDWHQLKTRILPFTGIGLPIGLIAFNLAPGPPLRMAFGIIVLSLAFVQLYQSRRSDSVARATVSARGAFFYLFCGGIMQGLYASGGPFVVYYTSRAILDKSRFRSTLCVLWLILNSVVCASLLWTGKITAQTLRDAGLLLPAVLLGLAVGERIHSRIPERTFRNAVYLLLALAGASLVFRK